MDPERSLLYTQDPATNLYPQPAESNYGFIPHFFRIDFNTSLLFTSRAANSLLKHRRKCAVFSLSFSLGVFWRMLKPKADNIFSATQLRSLFFVSRVI
jgi:hypothetical protein